jgi:hypothetical protein
LRAMRADSKMNLTYEEIFDLIHNALFEQSEDPKKLEDKYKGKILEIDYDPQKDNEFRFSKGDEWITKEGRYIFENEEPYWIKIKPTKRKRTVVFWPHTPPHFLQFRQYTDRKRAEFKNGISPAKLIHKLAIEVNAYLVIPKMFEETKDSISKTAALGINPYSKRKDKKLKNIFDSSYSKREGEEKLVLKLYRILSGHALYIDSQHLNMAFFYISIILQACGIRRTQHALYKKYKDIIPETNH